MSGRSWPSTLKLVSITCTTAQLVLSGTECAEQILFHICIQLFFIPCSRLSEHRSHSCMPLISHPYDDSSAVYFGSRYTPTLGGRFRLVRALFAEYHMILAIRLSSHPNSFRNSIFLSAKVSLQIEYHYKPFYQSRIYVLNSFVVV